jgi:hypothetical protein
MNQQGWPSGRQMDVGVPYWRRTVVDAAKFLSTTPSVQQADFSRETPFTIEDSIGSRSRAENRPRLRALKQCRRCGSFSLPCLRNLVPGAEQLDEPGDRGEPRVVVRCEIDDGATVARRRRGPNATWRRGR